MCFIYILYYDKIDTNNLIAGTIIRQYRHL